MANFPEKIASALMDSIMAAFRIEAAAVPSQTADTRMSLPGRIDFLGEPLQVA